MKTKEFNSHIHEKMTFSGDYALFYDKTLIATIEVTLTGRAICRHACLGSRFKNVVNKWFKKTLLHGNLKVTTTT